MSHETKWPVPVMAFLRARFMATLRLLEEKRAEAPLLILVNSLKWIHRSILLDF